MTAASITTIVAACASLEGLACVSADTALRCWARVSNSFDSHLQSSNDRGQRDKTKPSLSLATVSHSFKKPLSTGYTMWCITTTKKKKTASGFCPALPLASSHYTAAIHATSPIRLFASPASLSPSLSFPTRATATIDYPTGRSSQPLPARPKPNQKGPVSATLARRYSSPPPPPPPPPPPCCCYCARSSIAPLPSLHFSAEHSHSHQHSGPSASLLSQVHGGSKKSKPKKRKRKSIEGGCCRAR